MRHKIGVIINYCSNDYIFIRRAVEEVSKFAAEIIVPVADRFFDGSLEDRDLLNKTFKENPEARFILFEWHPQPPPFPGHWFWRLVPRRTGLRPLYGSPYWICRARFIGYKHLSESVKYILFLDADEIVDGEKFKRWLDTEEYQKFNAMKLACYFYIGTPSYQRKTYGESGILVKKALLTREMFFSYGERWTMYKKIRGRKKAMVMGTDDLPMVHHYGWARPKKNLLKKVKTWSHNNDADWSETVNGVISYRKKTSEFLQKYNCKIVRPYIKF